MCSTLDLSITHNGYDLNSRKLRRYIIEDVVYVNPIEHVLLLICEESNNFQYWNKIINEQNSGLSSISFGSKVYHQINVTVIKNVSRTALVNGEYDNDMIDYHVLGIEGASVSLTFSNCVRSTGIELKFSQLFRDTNNQMWGVAPMRRNLARALQRRGKASRMGLLKRMLDELSGDHAQLLQLATIAQQLISDDNTVKTATSALDHSVIMAMVVADTALGAQVAKKSLTYTGYESSLLQLNNIVQHVMMYVVSCTYGLFCSPNPPIIINVAVLGLVNRYK